MNLNLKILLFLNIFRNSGALLSSLEQHRDVLPVSAAVQRPDRQHAAVLQGRLDDGEASGAEKDLLHLRGSQGAGEDRVPASGSSRRRQHPLQHRTSDSHSYQNEENLRNHESQNRRSRHQWIVLDSPTGQFPGNGRLLDKNSIRKVSKSIPIRTTTAKLQRLSDRTSTRRKTGEKIVHKNDSRDDN